MLRVALKDGVPCCSDQCETQVVENSTEDQAPFCSDHYKTKAVKNSTERSSSLGF